ncbi:hypothetical protein CAPTEDRAFT_72174, partial [Capitella teleta]
VDYLVFGLSLVFTAGVGLFLSFYKRKNSSSEELLLASRSMHFLPVCLSLIASLVNASLILGVPAEIYFFGAAALPIAIAYNFVGPVAALVIVPTFYNMKLTSAYEYLERRYNYAVRIVGSIIFGVSLVSIQSLNLILTLFIYAVTSLSLPVAVGVTGGICTIYTMLGGIKAVIWTDTIQMVIMITGLIVLAGVGSSKVGGFGAVWQIAKDYNRVSFFEWNLDPRIRNTVWSAFFGQWVNYIGICFSNQMMIQRYLTVSKVRDAQLAVFLMMFFASILIVSVAILGWIAFAYYECDPLLQKRMTKGDQIVPILLMEILGDQAGVPGLIIASIFAAALSSVSSAVNSLAAVTLEDFIKPMHLKLYKRKLNEKMGTRLTIGFAFMFGAITIGISFAAQYMGDKLIEMTISVWSIFGGPVAGVFIMGFFFPWVNSAGALSGMLISLLLSLWLCIGGLMYKPPTPILPLRMGNMTHTIP